MSKISLTPNASGTGNFTIASPNSNTDRTLTLPDNTGTIITTASTFGGTGPAFSAYQSSAQSLTANTLTKLQLQTEEFDTANCFDNATNFRFTPNVAGYYQVSGAYTCSAFRTYQVVHIYKNGSAFKTSQAGNGTTGIGASISALIYLNGSTDYLELYGFSGVTQNTTNSQTDTWFQAVLVRAA